MKRSFIIAGCLALLAGACSQKAKKENKDSRESTSEIAPLTYAANQMMVVEASCGECQFDLPGKDCDLAVRFDGKAYFVDGTSIDDHGDAHADDGFCEAIRKAEVKGEIVNDRFKATYFKLLPDTTSTSKTKTDP